jgi:hypothetical protein
MNIEDLNHYISRIKEDSPTTWGDIRLQHTLKWDTILRPLITPWLDSRRHGLYVQPLQVERTLPGGWFLFSQRSINTHSLAQALKTDHGIDVWFRFQTISFGKASPTPANAQVKALHVSISAEEYDETRRVLYKIYNRRAKTFPLGIRLRFIPWCYLNNNPAKLENLLALRKKQEIFLAGVNTMTSWEITHLDTKKGPLSLREMILQLRSKNDPNKPLFLSVDRAWNNASIHVFAFLPSVASEARHMITILLPTLERLHGNYTNRYFTAAATERAATMRWDEARQEIITDEDELLELALTNEDDIEYFGLTEISDNLNAIAVRDQATERAIEHMENVFHGVDHDSTGTVATGTSTLGISGNIDTGPDFVSTTNSTTRSGLTSHTSVQASTTHQRVALIEASLQTLTSNINQLTQGFSILQSEMRSNFRPAQSTSDYTDAEPPDEGSGDEQ